MKNVSEVAEDLLVIEDLVARIKSAFVKHQTGQISEDTWADILRLKSEIMCARDCLETVHFLLNGIQK